ncbi:MAG: hypothetical protein JNK82_02790 [Myxococcaceae bacterium]|nr:hypothetical protein [Myxococcaceae bacterium]
MRAQIFSFVVASAVVGSCAQPRPLCPVAVGSPLGFPSPGSPLGFSHVQLGLPNFWASYTLKTGTGACSTLPGEEVGFQKLEIPLKPDETKVAIRPFLLSYIRGNPDGYGALDYADYDAAQDGPESVYRVDPADPDGAKVNGIAALAARPEDDNTCAVTGALENEQRFREERFTLVPGGEVSSRAEVDGGVAVFPELYLKYAWSNLKFVSTGEVPGSIFTAQLEYTEDTCTATYDVTGVWPITLCHTDLDCSPNPLPEASDTDISIPARRFQGSGLNPAFENEEHPFRCNNSAAVHAYTATYGISDFDEAGNPLPVYGISDWGVCEMTRPVSDFTTGP